MDIVAVFQSLINQPGAGLLLAGVLCFFLLRILFSGFRRRGGSHQKTLRAIARVTIEPQPVLNRSEQRVHRALSQIVAQAPGHSLLAQVSMGEFLSAKGRGASSSLRQTAFNAYNAKRVDFLIVDADWLPCAVVEYQGSGHNQGNARKRDAVKRAVCGRAGIAFVEVAPEGLTQGQSAELRRMLA